MILFYCKRMLTQTEITEQLFVEVDHCDPIAISFRAKGTYPCLLVDLPRVLEEEESQAVKRGVVLNFVGCCFCMLTGKCHCKANSCFTIYRPPLPFKGLVVSIRLSKRLCARTGQKPLGDDWSKETEIDRQTLCKIMCKQFNAVSPDRATAFISLTHLPYEKQGERSNKKCMRQKRFRGVVEKIEVGSCQPAVAAT